MARDHARIDVHMWTTDEDWIALSSLAKLLYLQLLSQPRLSYAGLLDLAVKRWARAHPDVSPGEVRAALAELDNRRFVVVDQDTEEVLIRSFIRRDGLYKQPQVLAAALRVAFEIESPILRAALAVELRRLPVEITGAAPAVAAAALEAGSREMPPAVKAALAERRSRRAAPTAPAEPVVLVDGQANAVDATAHPSGDPAGHHSAQAQGEGSRERETGEACLTLGNQVGVRAPARSRVPTPAPTRTREATAPRPDPSLEADAADSGGGSVRQRRRAEAGRLVRTHTPAQPRDVLDALRGKVIQLLVDGVEPAAIAAGLRIWASKTLSVSMLPELVGEQMRAHLRAASPATLTEDLATVAMFERVRTAAVDQDDQSIIGQAVRGELPAHIPAAHLGQLLKDAGQRALAVAVAGQAA